MPNAAEPAPKGVPAGKEKQWEEVYKSAFAKAKKDGKSDKEAESTAFAEAWGVVNKEKKSAVTGKRELRVMGNCELRATTGDGAPGISGYASVWDSPYEIPGFFGPGFMEQVRKGAFQRALSEGQDVRALFNHDPNQVLGRTSNGTLRLTEDERGLRYEIDLPDTTWGRDIHKLVQRGDIRESSFGFIVRGEEWIQEKGQPDQRILTDVDLFDVSPVTFPASGATSVTARSLWPDGAPEKIESRAVTKKEKDGDHPASHYLVVEDPQEPSTWHLRVKGTDGKPDHGLMGAAWAALHGGYRGNKYEGPNKQEAIDKLKALYKSEGMETPSENSSATEAEDASARKEQQLAEATKDF